MHGAEKRVGADSITLEAHPCPDMDGTKIEVYFVVKASVMVRVPPCLEYWILAELSFLF